MSGNGVAQVSARSGAPGAVVSRRRLSASRTVSLLLSILLLAGFVVSPLLPPVAAPAQAASPDPARGRQGMVASAEPHASAVGLQILRQGANAVDAAVAVAFALAVTFPQAGNLGGGGFMMVHGADGRTTAIDYREVAPAAATRDMFLDATGEPIEGEGSSLVGYRASGVPGTVAGMELAWQKYGSGKLAWTEILEPAIRLASHGFYVHHRLARSLREAEPLLARYPDSRRIYLNDGRFYNEGDLFRQPELAATLERIADQGAREFYAGETARLIAADMQRNRGLITEADLAAYQPRERAPIVGTYRGNRIVSMPPPSSGGVVLVQMLGMLEGYDLRAMGHNSSERYHLLTEAMRRAFADRAEYMADPDFVDVPIDRLTDPEYIARRRATIDPERASTSAEIGPGLATGAESLQTTHFTVVDTDGNAVSNTYTLNAAFGSGVVAQGTGVLLNNEMDDFAIKPGVPNLFGLIQGEQNAVEPGKRPLSSMTPTFVLRENGALWFTVGSPGGPTIINTALQIITNIIDHDMTVQQAVDMPRIHHQWLPDEVVYEPYGLSPDTLRAMEARGHRFTVRPRNMGDAQVIRIDPETGMRLGASDPRGYGAALGF